MNIRFLFFCFLQFICCESFDNLKPDYEIAENENSIIKDLAFIKVCLVYDGVINNIDIFRNLHFCKNSKDIQNALNDFHFEKIVISLKNGVFYINIKDAQVINNISFHISILKNDKIDKKIYDTDIFMGYYGNYLSRIRLPQFAFQYKKQINSRDIAASLEELKNYFISSGYTNASIDYRIELDDNKKKYNLKYYIFLDGFKRQNIIFSEDDRFLKRNIYQYFKLLFFDKRNLNEFFNYFDMRNILQYIIIVKNFYEQKNFYGIEYDFFYDSIKKNLHLNFKNKIKSDIVLKRIRYSDSVKFRLSDNILNKINKILKEDISLNLMKIKINKIIKNYYFEFDYNISITNLYSNNKTNISIFISNKKEEKKKVLKKINIRGNPNYLTSSSLTSILDFKLGDMVTKEELNRIKLSRLLNNKIEILPIVSSDDNNAYELNLSFPEKDPWWMNFATVSIDSQNGVSMNPEFKNLNGSLWNLSLFFSTKDKDPFKSNIDIVLSKLLFDNCRISATLSHRSNKNENSSINIRLNDFAMNFFKNIDDIGLLYSEFLYFFSNNYFIKDFEIRTLSKPFFRFKDSKYGVGLKKNIFCEYSLDKFSILFSGNIGLEFGRNDFHSLGFFNFYYNHANKGLDIFQTYSNIDHHWFGWDMVIRLNIHLVHQLNFNAFILFLCGNYDKNKNASSAIVVGLDLKFLTVGYNIVIDPGIYIQKNSLFFHLGMAS